ncbi:HD domain-containing protein [Aquitalea sp. LB_tupeE]|uniref:HD domain-containing protein n=1 Tax=Aquitalea sp. LB_tupeE TaxID=2748078 RepID=UPI0015BCA03C|nr:HD domain-containing protein [Aquitalea sp. LB_tupeE]NWK76551.1 HD domain-containing protein [Aquitalea sp. LB_tupeE]
MSPLDLTPQLQHWQQLLIGLLQQQDPDADGAHDLTHFHRVWAVARQILPHHPQADALVVLAACYLHDLVNLPKNHPDRAQASRQAAIKASQLLADAGFPADKLAAVVHAIEAHSFSANIPPQSDEARIVQDADRMDALGAIGLARMFYTSGRMGRQLAHPDNPSGDGRVLDDREYALDHIEVKLEKLPSMMQTEAGRAMAAERVARLHAFRQQFIEEWLAR